MTTLQVRPRTATPDLPPAAGSLKVGELYLEMAAPLRLWVGVPISLEPTGRKLLFAGGGEAAAVSAGAGLAGQLLGTTYQLSHADTSNALSSSSGPTQYLKNLQLDTFGHVTGLEIAEFPQGGGTYAPLIHSHSASQISDLDDELAAYALINHTHVVADIPELQNIVAGKADLSGASFSGAISSQQITAKASPTTPTTGGELRLERPSIGSSLGGPVSIIFEGDYIKVRESVAPFRGFFVAMATLANNAGTQLLTQADSPIPPGTAMLFRQAAAPSGWTRVTTASLDDTLLRVVTASSYNSAVTGVYAVSTFFTNLGATGSTTLTVGQLPSHTHPTYLRNDFAFGGSGMASRADNAAAADPALAATLPTGGGQGHSHPLDIRVKYLDLIICTKN